MCCFSGAVESVTNTRIFARLTGKGTQFVVYQMNWKAQKPVAMILPVPVVQGKPDAIRFINLKEYASFFDDLRKGFPAPKASRGGFGAGNIPAPAAALPEPLPVAEVGDFVASFVPTIADFARLDPRFVLPTSVWDQVPSYRRYGFAVFQLKAAAKNGASVHPMAFEFDTRMGGSLFFPTLHIHDGAVHPREDFDHTLYTQGVVIGEKSPQNAEKFIAMDKALGVVDGKLPVSRKILKGHLQNRDTIYAA